VEAPDDDRQDAEIDFAALAEGILSEPEPVQDGPVGPVDEAGLRQAGIDPSTAERVTYADGSIGYQPRGTQERLRREKRWRQSRATPPLRAVRPAPCRAPRRLVALRSRRSRRTVRRSGARSPGRSADAGEGPHDLNPRPSGGTS
jgi:hypothetical protein